MNTLEFRIFEIYSKNKDLIYNKKMPLLYLSYI